MKVFILGNIASGKTTLSHILEQKYHVPVFSIDQIVHNDENHCKRSEEEQIKIINDIIHNHNNWIIEGMPRSLLNIIASSASSIIYLDYDMKIIQRRLRNRYFLQRLSFVHENYPIDKNFYHDMKKYQSNYDGLSMNEFLKKYSRKIFIIKTKKDYKAFLKAVEKGIEL